MQYLILKSRQNTSTQTGLPHTTDKKLISEARTLAIFICYTYKLTRVRRTRQRLPRGESSQSYFIL